jgi:hypothetical protein
VSGPDAPQLPDGPLMRVRERFTLSFWEDLSHDMAQAVGMVSAQAACSASQALDLMKDRARAQQLTLDEIAEGVLDRAIRFDQ